MFYKRTKKFLLSTFNGTFIIAVPSALVNTVGTPSGKPFDLKMTTRRIMEVAYLGEITTFSRCGKLDQACAYSSPVLMKFDGDRVTTNELKVGKDNKTGRLMLIK